MILVLRINLHYKYIFVTRYFDETADPMHKCLSLVVKKSQSCQKYYYGAFSLTHVLCHSYRKSREEGDPVSTYLVSRLPSESEKIRSSVV